MIYKRGNRYWYKFKYLGKWIYGNPRTTSATVARQAERDRRQELERGYNGINSEDKAQRVQTLEAAVAAFLADSKIRKKPATYSYEEHALRHVTRLTGDMMRIEVSWRTVVDYQAKRLEEKAAEAADQPKEIQDEKVLAAGKSINEEVRLLLQVLEDQGDEIRLKLKREKKLKLRQREGIGIALNLEQEGRLLAAAEPTKQRAADGTFDKGTRSHLIKPFLALALNTGMRDKTMKNVQWWRLDFLRRIVTVGGDKTNAGTGRTIPMNDFLFQILVEYRRWYEAKVSRIAPDLFVFPFGRDTHWDAKRPITSFKTVWENVRDKAGLKVRLHDLRHTLITKLAEDPTTSDETIMAIAGWVSRRMMTHYSHIRMEAKRKALAAIPTPVLPAAKTGTEA